MTISGRADANRADGASGQASARSAPPLLHAGEQLQHRGGRRVAAARVLHCRRQLLGELLAELDAPLVEGIDAPRDALREYAVLVERDETTERRGIELPEEHQRARPAAGIHLVGHEGLDLRRRHPGALEL